MKQALFSFALLGLMMGMPFAHGLTPKEDKNAFGKAVSEKAKLYPGAVADHIAEQRNGGPEPQ